MNKKIKIIDLLHKIANKEKVPKKIKILGNVFEWFGDSYRKKGAILEYISDYVRLDCMLNDEIDILEDNTEEIKELKFCIEKGNSVGYYINDIVDKIDELVRAVNELRKELNK